jgi:hypothetical protein
MVPTLLTRTAALQRTAAAPNAAPRVLSTLRRFKRAALVTTFFAALAIANSYPIAFKPASTLGLHGDAYFSVWRLAWIAHQLPRDPRHLFDGNIFYPERGTLAYSDAILLPGILVAPLNWAGIDPLALYNLTLLAAFVLNALAGFLLVHCLTRSVAAGLLGGVIFAFSPYRFDHFDHLEMQFAFWIPLVVLAWHKACSDRSRGAVAREKLRDYLRVAALTACQILSCIYYGVFLLAWLAVVTTLWFVRTPAKAIKAGTAMLLPPLLVLGVYSLPYLQIRGRLGDRSPREVAGYSARLSDFLSAPSSNVLYGQTSTLSVDERHLFPGFAAAALLIVGLWPPFDRLRLLHAAGLALALQLTLGFNGFLYKPLYEWVLPFRGLRVPARADVLVLLGTSVLAGFGLARLTRGIERRRLSAGIAAGAIAIASIEYAARPRLQTVDRRVSVWYHWLKSIPDAVVFEWPTDAPWRLHEMVDVNYMYRSTLHWRPLLNGYSGHYPRSYIDLLLAMRSFPYTGSIEYLRQMGANVLVVHDVGGSRPSYEEALARLAREPGIQVFAQGLDAGNRVTVFRLSDPSDSGAR